MSNVMRFSTDKNLFVSLRVLRKHQSLSFSFSSFAPLRPLDAFSPARFQVDVPTRITCTRMYVRRRIIALLSFAILRDVRVYICIA